MDGPAEESSLNPIEVLLPALDFAASKAGVSYVLVCGTEDGPKSIYGHGFLKDRELTILNAEPPSTPNEVGGVADCQVPPAGPSCQPLSPASEPPSIPNPHDPQEVVSNSETDTSSLQQPGHSREEVQASSTDDASNQTPNCQSDTTVQHVLRPQDQDPIKEVGCSRPWRGGFVRSKNIYSSKRESISFEPKY